MWLIVEPPRLPVGLRMVSEWLRCRAWQLVSALARQSDIERQLTSVLTAPGLLCETSVCSALSFVG